MKNKTFKQFIIIIILVICVVGVYSFPKLFIKQIDEELPEVKLKDIKSKKSFAIMVQNGDGYEEYTSEDNMWPGADYVFKEAKCTDNNGTLVNDAITFTRETKTVTLETDKTVVCTLYFDKSIIGNLRSKDTQRYLSKDLQGGMYRYQATPADEMEAAKMTNWICFGTTNKEDCTNEETGIDKYMYRIIGITEEGKMYLIKETFVKEGEITGFSWNSKYLLSDCLGEACEWPNTDIYKRLNGISNGTSAGHSGNTNIFLGTSEHPSSYEYLTEENEWYNLIEEHNWMYGDTNEISNSKVYNGDAMYEIEIEKVATKRYWLDEGQEICSSDSPCTEKEYTWSKSISAQIGLMYMHDVDYAYTGGNPGNMENVKNSWIHYQKDRYNLSSTNEWLITRYSVLNDGVLDSKAAHIRARLVYPTGFIGYHRLTDRLGARPVFYLKSTTNIASGSGTKTDPFILAIDNV